MRSMAIRVAAGLATITVGMIIKPMGMASMI